MEDHVKKMKRQVTDWRKYLQTSYLIKDSYLGTLKNNSNVKSKTSNLIRKWVKDMKEHFTEED